ncbi:DNA-binding protein [Pectobacterium atrosepticum]|nr:DNA-binding protein [Pectobacterium atrosepticum]
MMSISSWVTAKDIAGLPGLPSAISSVLRKAKKENWVFRQKCGIKGVAYEFNFDGLPMVVQNALRERYYNTLLQQQPVKALAVAKTSASSSQLLEIVRQCPAVLDQKTAEMTQKQRDIADARMVLVVEVLRLEDTGLSRIKSINFICDRSRSGDLPAHLHG